MSEVVGPFTLRDWNTLRSLKKSINKYLKSPQEKFKQAYDLEIVLYKNKLKQYVA